MATGTIHKSILTTVTHTSQNYTISSRSYVDFIIEIQKSGYYPVGIVGHRVGWRAGNTVAVSVPTITLSDVSSGYAKITGSLYNGNQSGEVTTYMQAVVLWMKE